MGSGPIESQPSATKRSRAQDLSSSLLLPTKAVEGFWSLFNSDDVAAPARECAESRPGTGVEAPVAVGAVPALHLDRSFVFVDLSGFTAFVDRHGEHQALEVLSAFRAITRELAARRGVRVGKWLGDGVMLVGVEPAVVAATAAEMLCHSLRSGGGIALHAGLASGPVLLFEGDDYIGRPVNLASRLCEAAGPGEILAVIDDDELPDWVSATGHVTVRATGVGDVAGVSQLEVAPEVLRAFRSDTAA